MYEKEKRELQSLDKFNRWLTVTHWRWLLIKQNYSKQSLPLRLVPLHAIFMLIVIFSFPHGYPALVIAPILFAAAYYISLLLLFVIPSAYKSKVRKVVIHWIK